VDLLGLVPSTPYHLLALLVPIVGWLLTRAYAKRNHITVMHNSSLAVSYWEELLFRGIAYGLLFAVWRNGLIAILGSSLLFSLLHLRNLWWSSPKRLLFQLAYTGLFFGPIAAMLRWWSGDIYFSIAFHAINNFTVLVTPGSAPIPDDEFLLSRVRKMKWWQRGIIGFWSANNSLKKRTSSS